MDDAGAPHELPVDVLRSQARERRVAPVIHHPDRAWRNAVFEEVEAHARIVDRAHGLAIDAVPGELTPRALAPRVGRQRRDPRDTKPEARGDRRDVGFGAADLDVELPNGFEARGRRQRETEENFTEGDEIVHRSVA